MISRILDWLAGGRAPWEAEPSPPKAKGGCVIDRMVTCPVHLHIRYVSANGCPACREQGQGEYFDDCSERQAKDALMYVRLVKAQRQRARDNGLPPETDEAKRRRLELRELEQRVRLNDISLGRVDKSRRNEHELEE